MMIRCSILRSTGSIGRFDNLGICVFKHGGGGNATTQLFRTLRCTGRYWQHLKDLAKAAFSSISAATLPNERDGLTGMVCCHVGLLRPGLEQW